MQNIHYTCFSKLEIAFTIYIKEGEIEDKDSFENMCTACISITRDSNSNIYCIKHII